MELSALQLTEVKDYVAKGWKYPDVQVAVTDHIKYRIQERMESDTTFSLNDALILTHAEFGPQSFQIFENNLKAGAKYKYNKLFLKVLADGFKLINVLSALVFIAMIGWLFLTLQPVKLGAIPNGILSAIVSFLPIYLMVVASGYSKAKLYAQYQTMIISNAVLSRWCLAPTALMTVLYHTTAILKSEQLFLPAGICCSLMILSGFLFIRAGYIVREATIQDCREIEARLSAIQG